MNINKWEIIKNISLRKAAIIAGLGLLTMTILAIFANFFVLESFVVSGDAAKTANNILTNEGIFRLGICSFIIVAILDVVVAWALYIVLKPVNKNLSLLSAWFRLVYAAILGIAIHNLFSALQLLNGTGYLTAFEPNQLHAQAMLFLNAFTFEWTIGLVFFGIHLSTLGYLIFKSGYIPKFLGILVIIAGLGYLIDSFVIFLLPNYHIAIGMFTFIGELIFMLWLLFKGAKISSKEYKERE